MKILFDSDLRISYVWRYYIAYMAASTHKCEYLMKLTEYYCKLFHEDWFNEPNEIPNKLKCLSNANIKLAHRPWEFTDADVKILLETWNANELVLALSILSQFHCLSGFVFGLGVAPEIDLPLSTFKEPSESITKSANPKSNPIEVLKEYSETSDTEDFLDSFDEIIVENHEDVNFSTIAGGYLPYINYPMDTINRLFNPSDFKFCDQAYYILEKIVPEISETIWNRIRATFSMTYQQLGEYYNIETEPLRRAIWNYVQRVYGIQYDDYNYNNINRLLKIGTKKYIKKTACFPENVTKDDFNGIDLDITSDEIIHLNLMICEARFEAQLVYMLHSVHRALDLG